MNEGGEPEAEVVLKKEPEIWFVSKNVPISVADRWTASAAIDQSTVATHATPAAIKTEPMADSFFIQNSFIVQSRALSTLDAGCDERASGTMIWVSAAIRTDAPFRSASQRTSTRGRNDAGATGQRSEGGLRADVDIALPSYIGNLR
jgi:hypothetical protein